VRPAPTREELRPATAAVALTVTVAVGLLVWTATETYDAFHDDGCDGPCHEMVIHRLLTPVGVLISSGLLAAAVGGLVAVLRRSPAAGATLTVVGLAFLVCALPAAALERWVSLAMIVVGLGNVWLGQRAIMKDWA
jgi:hypothetical protein